MPAHHVSRWQIVLSPSLVTDHVLHHSYVGSGSEEDPYAVEFLPDDPRDPQNFTFTKKWTIAITVAFATLAVACASSAYTGGISEIIHEFQTSGEVAVLGLTLFVLGFAIGPLLWGPLSELYGRQSVFFSTYGMFVVFNAATCGARNIQTLVVLRFIAGLFGSSPLTNAGGVIADMFNPAQRGLAMSIYSAAPFLGPTLGPIIGGFLGEEQGWRWVQGFLAIFSGALWIMGSLVVPETYAPYILKRRAAKLARMTGKVFKSKLEVEKGRETLAQAFKRALTRPWVLLFSEPIVSLLSTYVAIIFGTLYLMFAAFPIVYQEARGWSPGIGGLPFLGVMVGMLAAVLYGFPENKRYARACQEAGGKAAPEARLWPTMIGSICLPVGLFWFSWTNGPSVHWMVSILATVPFGFGMVLVFLSVANYLIDSYTIYAASVLAANSILRSLFGAAFPLFTAPMYRKLGIHWASTIPASLALMCVPFPFLFYKYGARIRARCKYSAESMRMMEKLRAKAQMDRKREASPGSSAPVVDAEDHRKESTDSDVEKGSSRS